MNEVDLRRMSREELEDLMEKVMFRLRQFDAQDLHRDIVTKSQMLRLGSAHKK
jgi:hypothetical protein